MGGGSGWVSGDGKGRGFTGRDLLKSEHVKIKLIIELSVRGINTNP